MPYTRPDIGPAPELHHARRNRFRAAMRDTIVLLREFQSVLLLFGATLLVGGLVWMVLSNLVEPEPVNYPESIYAVLQLTFFQSDDPFPPEWYRELFFFLMPVLGLAILGRGAADFAVLLFNRQARQAQWEVALASTFKNHVIICGLGHVGIRVVRELVSLGVESIVVIDFAPDIARAEECRDYGIPIVESDGKRSQTLLDAGVDDAESFIVCTNDDLLNLQIALNAREQNPKLRIVMRMFDDALGRQLAEHLGIENIFSASALAAPSFAGAATGTAVTQSFYVEDEVMNMSRLRVQPGSGLDGVTVANLERERDLSVILHQRDMAVDLHPNQEVTLQAGDLIVIFSTLPVLSDIRRLNRVGEDMAKKASDPSSTTVLTRMGGRVRNILGKKKD